MLLIKSGRLIDPEKKSEAVCDILIDGGVIAKIGRIEPQSGMRIIGAEGLCVAPGLIDAHAHFREPGFTYKEDIASGAEAAKRGGFTTIVCMANTKPAVDNPETLKEVLEAGSRTGISILSAAAVSEGLTGERLTDMDVLRKSGAVCFSDDGQPISDAGFLCSAMLKVKELGMPVSLHEEDPSLIYKSGINDGAVSRKLGLKGAPPISESSMVARDAMLALDTGAKVHFQHLSAAESVEIVRLAKKHGAYITAEVTPQHFTLTEDAVLSKGTLAKLNPPFRSEHDRQSLIDGLKDGTIDIIATDHAPHSGEEKSRDFTDAPSGIIGLETALALGITMLVREKHLTLPELIEKMTVNPARLFGLRAGRVAEDEKADIVIFDEAESFIAGEFASKSSNSPFIGEKLYGKVKYTICGGKVVYEDNIKGNEV